MPISGEFAIVTLGVGAAALIAWRRWTLHRRGTAGAFRPTNELERLLEQAVGTAQGTSALREELLRAELLAPRSGGRPRVPMDVTFQMPASLGGGVAEAKGASADGMTTFGPAIMCFSSDAALRQISGHPISSLFFKADNMGRFAGRELMEQSLARGVELLLNPFGAVSRRFTPDELRSMLVGGDA